MKTSDCLVRIATSESGDPAAGAREVFAALRPHDLAGAIFFCGSSEALNPIAAEAQSITSGATIVGCTTAGEITPWGARKGSITAVGFPLADFSMLALRFDGLLGFDPFAAQRTVVELIADAAAQSARLGLRLERTGLLLIDGLSCREELVTHTMRDLLDGIPMIGGSAGDNLDFRPTHLLHDGVFRSDSAVLVMLTARRPLRVFRSHHHAAGDRLAVITQADAAARRVQELNGEPAAQEYARLAGIDAQDLSYKVLAQHPMMVRVGGDYYARAVMRADDDGSLIFHSAIERGLVLRLGHSTGLIESLTTGLAQCGEIGSVPDAVIAFDSAQNWIEAQAAGLTPDLLEIYRRNRFVGFQSYGEQYRDLHLNRNLVGLAIGKQLC